jgi:DNA transposition AAA+ family ATPase
MIELTSKEKDAIRGSLQAYCAKYPSQNRATGSLKGVSAGTVSTLLSGRYENISDEMFRNIAAQVGGVSASGGWQIVETGAFQEIRFAVKDAQEFRNVTWIVGDAGCGKTTAAQAYRQEGREVFYVLCSEDMSKAEFIRETARAIGLRYEGYTLRELWDMIIGALIQMDSPLMIFDEADKLTDTVFHYFISFYNRLEDRCGIIFMSTDYIKRRMDLGLRHNKKGYNEIHSRIGRKFFQLDRTTANDVYAICSANGLRDKAKISEVIRDAGACDFDLRRVKKSVHRVKRLNEQGD